MFKESAIRDSQSVSNAVSGEHVSKVSPANAATSVRVVTAKASVGAAANEQNLVSATSAASSQPVSRVHSVQVINIPKLAQQQKITVSNVQSVAQQSPVAATKVTNVPVRPVGNVVYVSGSSVQKPPAQTQTQTLQQPSQQSTTVSTVVSKVAVGELGLAPAVLSSDANGAKPERKTQVLVSGPNVVPLPNPTTVLLRKDVTPIASPSTVAVRTSVPNASVNASAVSRAGDSANGPIVIDGATPSTLGVRPAPRPVTALPNRPVVTFAARQPTARVALPVARMPPVAPMSIVRPPGSTVRLVTNMHPNTRPVALPRSASFPQLRPQLPRSQPPRPQPRPQLPPPARPKPPVANASKPNAASPTAAQRTASQPSSTLSVLEPTEELEEIGLTETYSIYEPKKLKLGRPHPDPVVETSSLSSVEPPDIHYKLHLPKSVIEEGRLSSLQLEAVVYACQRHDEFLPNGERAGYFIGDGAGVGKGRAIAGIIYENWLRGRKRAIWLSVSADLKFDAERDLFDVIGPELQSAPAASSLDPLAGRASRQTGLSLADVRELLAGATNSAAGRTCDTLEAGFATSTTPAEELPVTEEPAAPKRRRGPKVPVYALNKLSYGKISGDQNGNIRKGVMFATYSSLIAESNSTDVSSKYNTRLKQLLRWAGEQFDGLIVFDECHRAKNLLPGASGKSTKTGLAVLQLQAALPRARVVYASATGASEPRNMAYMVRLGLWGVGTAFRDFSQCLDMLEKRGVGAMELLAMEMKQRGMYIARQLSFAGVHFRIEPVPLSDDFVDVYNRSVDFWSELKRQLDYALSRLGGTTGRAADGSTGVEKQIWSQFWSAHQRFFKYLCISAKLDHCVDMTRRALEEDKCVVIGLQSTGESKLVQALGSAANGELTEFVSSAKEVLRSFVTKHFPSTDTERACADRFLAELTDLVAGDGDIDALLDRPAGRKRKSLAPNSVAKRRRMRDDDMDEELDEAQLESEADALLAGLYDDDDDIPSSSSKPKSSKAVSSWQSGTGTGTDTDDVLTELNSVKRDLLDQIEALGSDLPANSLDRLIEALGGTAYVAEMTGRRLRTVTDQMSGDVVVETRAEPDVSIDLVNHLEKARFMDGSKLIAIISDAASSGISLQADRRANNQRKRVHITLELAWSADRAVQQFGRTHRSNQVCAPEYVFMISELAGEQRFASTVARRLESLGALTQGDRRAATESSNDLSRFNIDTKYGQQALERTLASLSPSNRVLLRCVGLVPADGSNDAPQNDTGNITLAKFLNRLLGLRVAEQNALFEQFVSSLRSVLLQAKLDGRLELGMLDLGAAEGEQVVLVSKQFLSVTRAHLYTAQLERGLTFEKALQMYAATLQHDSGSAGFYLSRAKHGKRYVPILALPDLRTATQKLAAAAAAASRAALGNKAAPGQPRTPAQSERLYRAYMANTGLKAKFMTEAELSTEYRRVESREMQPIWNDLYVATERSCVHAYWYDEQCARETRTNVPCDVGKRIRTLFVLTGTILSTFKTLDNAILGAQSSANSGTTSSRDKPALPKLQLIRLRLNRNDIHRLERLEREEEYERTQRAEPSVPQPPAFASADANATSQPDMTQNELDDAMRALDQAANQDTQVSIGSSCDAGDNSLVKSGETGTVDDVVTPSGLSKMVRDSLIGCLLQPQFVPMLRRVTSTPDERVYHFSNPNASQTGQQGAQMAEVAADAAMQQFSNPVDESSVFVGFGMDAIDAEFM